MWKHHHITPAAYAARETVAPTSAVNAHTMPDELLLVPTIIHKGQYPLYDVAVRFSELARGKAFDIGGALRSYPVGNMALGLAAMTGIRLPHHGKDARNRTWIQFLRMRWVGDGGARATKVMRGTQELHREVSANFPRQQDGSIDWGEPGAQDAVPR